MKNKSRINICVCTFLRPKHLAECLTSLINLKVPKGATYLITVIDNDKNRSAETVVDNIKTQNEKVPIHYFCEENRGIPFARNRALDESLKLDADYIAFIDDDELASCDWLSVLYEYLSSYSEEVVIHGQVLPRFPEDISNQIRDLFYTKKIRATGTQLQTCATNNVIFPVKILNKFKLRFDVSLPLAGGTDTKFFLEVHDHGIPIYECAEAIVFETIFPSRLKMNWIIRRKYRSGITTAWRRHKEGYSKFILALKASLDISMRIFLITILAVFFLRTARNKQLLKAARSFGILAGILGIETESYANIDR